MSVKLLPKEPYLATSPKELQMGEIIADVFSGFAIDKTCFGIGGDYISAALPFFNRNFKLISSSNEQNAGYSAIANSILKNMPSIALATWNVGSLSQLECMKYAEDNNYPIIFISGGLGTDDMKKGSAHHAVSSIRTSKDDIMISVNAVKSLGMHSISLLPENGLVSKGGKKIFSRQEDIEAITSKLFNALEYSTKNSKPVYIEIPRDVPVAYINELYPPKKADGDKKSYEPNMAYNEDDKKFLKLFDLSTNVVDFSMLQEKNVVDVKTESLKDYKLIKEIIVNNFNEPLIIADNHRALGISYAIASSYSLNDHIPVLLTTKDLFQRRGVNELIKLAQTKKKSCIILFNKNSDDGVDNIKFAQSAGLKSSRVSNYLELADQIKTFDKDSSTESLLIEIKMYEYPDIFMDKIEDISGAVLKDTFSKKFLDLLYKKTSKIVYKGDYYKNHLLTRIFHADSRFKLNLSPDSMSAGYAAGVIGKRSYNLGIALFDSITGANGIANALAENYPMLVLHTSSDDKDKAIQTAKTLGVRTFDVDKRTSHPLDEINKAIQYAKKNLEPVYVEISKEVLLRPCPDLSEEKDLKLINREKLDKMADNLIDKIRNIPSNENIYIYIGEKFGFNETLIEQIKEFSSLTNIPIASSLYIKSSCPDDFKLSLGTYWGAFSRPETVKFIDSATYAIKLGEPTLQRDLGAGFYTFKDTDNFTFNGYYPNGRDLQIFLESLISKVKINPIEKRDFADEYKSSSSLLTKKEYESFLEKPITLKNYYKMMSTYIEKEKKEDMINIFDCGTSWFGSFSMHAAQKDSYLASNFYASMGFSLPALDAVKEINTDKFPILLTGDGAFQMTGFSSMAKLIKEKKNAVVIMFRNDKYALGSNLESPINVTANENVNYAKMITAMGGEGIDNIYTFKELFVAIKNAKSINVPTFIEIKYNSKFDIPRESWLVDTWISMMKGDERAKDLWKKIKTGELNDVSK